MLLNDVDNPRELYLIFGTPVFSPLSMDGEHSTLKVLSLLEAGYAQYLHSFFFFLFFYFIFFIFIFIFLNFKVFNSYKR